MKTIIFDGRVGQNGTEVKMSKNGKPYARFTVANNAFVNGEEKTEWFDVTVYDPTFIEKRAQYLGKGSYVIVTGSIRTEIRPDQSGKVWVNHYVTATNIDTPRFGGKTENKETATTDATPVVSTFTGGTKSDLSVTAPTVQPTTQSNVGNFTACVTTTEVPNVQVAVVGVAAGAGSSVEDDDLPF